MTALPPRLIAAGLILLGIALLAYAIPRARAAESDRATGYRIQVCPPDGGDCRMRGKVLGATACSLDLASVQLVVTDGSRLTCVKVVDGVVVRR